MLIYHFALLDARSISLCLFLSVFLSLLRGVDRYALCCRFKVREFLKFTLFLTCCPTVRSDLYYELSRMFGLKFKHITFAALADNLITRSKSLIQHVSCLPDFLRLHESLCHVLVCAELTCRTVVAIPEAGSDTT